jgi:hypothetical protein
MDLEEVDMHKPISVTITPAKPHLDIRTLKGPSVFVPFAAVVAEFTVPTPITPPRVATVLEAVAARLPEAVVSRIQILDWGAPFETVVAGLAQALQDWRGPNNLPCRTGRTSSDRGLVYLGYHDELATAYALQIGYELALVAFAEGQRPINADSGLVARVVQLGAVMERPGDADRAMIQEARARGIPVYRVVRGLPLLQYGQGKYGRHYWSASSQCDSPIGVALQNNKMMSNFLVRRLGFPGVEHGVANTAGRTAG